MTQPKAKVIAENTSLPCFREVNTDFGPSKVPMIQRERTPAEVAKRWFGKTPMKKEDEAPYGPTTPIGY